MKPPTRATVSWLQLRRRAARKLLWEGDRLLAKRIGHLEHLRWQTRIAASHTDPPMLFHTGDQELGPHIWDTGTYEGDELAWALEHLGHPQRGRTVVEVGANVGTTSVPLLAVHGAATLEAWEPAPANLRLLRCNLILGAVEDRAVVHGAAVSDHPGTLRLELSETNSGDHRVAAIDPAWELWAESGRAGLDVAAVTLDEGLTTDPGQVGLVWVDTQGHEAHVFSGASRLLGRGIPWVIEYWPYGLARARGLERLHAELARHYDSVVDVRASIAADRVVRLPVAALPGLATELGAGYTDLVLVEGA